MILGASSGYVVAKVVFSTFLFSVFCVVFVFVRYPLSRRWFCRAALTRYLLSKIECWATRAMCAPAKMSIYSGLHNPVHLDVGYIVGGGGSVGHYIMRQPHSRRITMFGRTLTLCDCGSEKMCAAQLENNCQFGQIDAWTKSRVQERAAERRECNWPKIEKQTRELLESEPTSMHANERDCDVCNSISLSLRI